MRKTVFASLVLAAHSFRSPLTTFASTRLMSTSTNAAPGRGAFILFEGVDRCGKTTQTKLLAEYCQDKAGSAELIRFPNRETTIGTLIDSYLRSASNLNDNSIHLLFSANRWEASEGMEKSLLSGTTLVCDRYAYSGVAFTSAKGIDLQWCKTCDQGLPAPDCIIYLDIPVEEAAQRGAFGEERYEKIDFQIKVRNQFLQLKAEDEASANVPWHVLDARKTIEELQAEIKVIADRVINESKEKPITKLWV